MIKEIQNFHRKELFEWYNKCHNSYLYLTTKIDVTNVVNYCKIHKKFYATMGYLVTKAANQVDAFKYRYQDGKFYYCNPVKSNFTEMVNDDEISFFGMPHFDYLDEYVNEFIKRQKALKNGDFKLEDKMDEIWISCFPWFSFSSIMTPNRKSATIPQFIWDKFVEENGRYYVNLMIMGHHGFIDGNHIAKYIATLNNIIKDFK